MGGWPVDSKNSYHASYLRVYNNMNKDVLPPFQIIRRFGFSRYIAFARHSVYLSA